MTKETCPNCGRKMPISPKWKMHLIGYASAAAILTAGIITGILIGYEMAKEAYGVYTQTLGGF